MTLRTWLAVAGLVSILGLAGGVWWHGYRSGEAAQIEAQDRERRARQQELDRAAETIRQQADQLKAQRDAQDMLTRQIEDAARADPDNARRGIGSDGMRRLERLWGSPD